MDYELQRFLFRCPDLASISQFDYLLKKVLKILHSQLTFVLSICFEYEEFISFFKIVNRVIKLLKKKW